MSVRIAKDTSERYTVRFDDAPRNWAIITISQHGDFHCHSDVGDFSYRWTDIGNQSFKEFLIDLERDKGYLMGKIAPHEPSMFDLNGTVDWWKRTVANRRRDGRIEATTARRAWDTLSTLDRNMNSSECVQALLAALNGFEDALDFEEVVDGPCYKVGTSTKVFLERIFPAFVEELRREVMVAS